MDARNQTGVLLCVASAACFGAMGIFGKLAYDDGVSVATLLCVRFTIAALVLWVVLAVRRSAPRGALLAGLGLGAVGYALQAGLFFAALDRMDASLLAIVLYTYPAMVTVAAIALGRERADRRRVAALAVSSIGLVLVLADAAEGAVDALAAAMAIGAALTYTAYILVSDRVRMDALPLAALVTTGAAVTFLVFGTASGRLDTGFAGQGWLWLVSLALVSTVGAIVLFFAGLRRVGPSSAAILSTFEPVVTVGLAAAAFGEALSPVQLLGGLLVLGAVVVLNVRPRGGAPALATRIRARSH